MPKPTLPKVVEAAPKKIILCCDGTSQSSVNGKASLPSNITRIARTIAKAGLDGDKVWQQLVYYDAGVGTGVGTGIVSTIENTRQGATGDGLIINVLEAYNFVVNNYSPGDKIYCFGFSRGAFTARAVAGMITDLGVIKPDNMKHFPSLFAAYQKNTDKSNFRKTKEYFEWYAGKVPLVPESQKETFYPQIPWYNLGVRTLAGCDIEYENSRSVELVGVFDTVGSIGLSETYFHPHKESRRQYEWLNVKWNPYIKHVFHALALDDRRQPFIPTLYYIPNDKIIADENEILKKDEADWPELTEHRKRVDEDLKRAMEENHASRSNAELADKADLVQVWFTGVHINVGGGNDAAGKDFEGLANITFAWMVEQCRPYLAFDDFTNATLANYMQRIVEHQVMESASKKQPGMVDKAVTTISETGKWLGSFFFSPAEEVAPKEKMVRSYCFSAVGTPEVNLVHWALFQFKDSYVPLYKAISFPEERKPGACDDRSTEARKLLCDLGRTNEWIHPSVKWRIDVSKDMVDLRYNSKPLQAFNYEKRDGVYGWQHQEQNDLWIPEWPITAALKDADTSVYNENAEMALVEQCGDHDDVRKFLRERAAAWLKAHPAAK